MQAGRLAALAIGQGRGERARCPSPSCFKVPPVLLAFLLALPWAPWNSLKGSTFKEMRVLDPILEPCHRIDARTCNCSRQLFISLSLGGGGIASEGNCQIAHNRKEPTHTRAWLHASMSRHITNDFNCSVHAKSAKSVCRSSSASLETCEKSFPLRLTRKLCL